MLPLIPAEEKSDEKCVVLPRSLKIIEIRGSQKGNYALLQHFPNHFLFSTLGMTTRDDRRLRALVRTFNTES